MPRPRKMRRPVPGQARISRFPGRRPQGRPMNFERAASIGDRPGAQRRGATGQRAAMERKRWRIPLIGMFLEPILNFFFPGRAYRTGMRRGSVAGKAGSLIGVKMDLINQARRDRYDRLRERAPVTGVKGHQFARKGKLPGVLKRKAA